MRWEFCMEVDSSTSRPSRLIATGKTALFNKRFSNPGFAVSTVAVGLAFFHFRITSSPHSWDRRRKQKTLQSGQLAQKPDPTGR
ncbi:Hypothetical protein NTJ_05868 [Nesidiocoris tenuis]|uniref:Transmembrane protein n=1 Tax=Nesidiocoris tenuis TaxID=355587 RepID=A0ABN7AP65_9HEMI|nr:Hypothetical protein NTJ_05868 [Nesidiocoris tenuis]